MRCLKPRDVRSTRRALAFAPARFRAILIGMRPLIWIAASVLAAASCGKQLNPEYCATHPTDVDCENTGMVTIDAPKPCMMNSDCPTGVCDTKIGQCVECTVAMPMCSGATPVCDVDDHCHACTATDATHCTGAGAVCLPDDTCASADSFWYARPNGTGTMCSMAMPCDLATAVGKLDPTHRVISLEKTTGPHYTGGLTIAANAVIFGDASRGVTGPADAIIDGSLSVATAITVAIDNASVTGSPGAGIQCAAGTLTFHYSNSYNNVGAGILTSNACTLNVDRSAIYSNQGGGLLADASTVHVANAFIYGNGNPGGAPAVRLSGGTSGSFNYSSIAYNLIKKNTDAFSCQGSATVAFDIITGNTTSGNGSQFSSNGCSTNQDLIGADPTTVFTSPTDLHLKSGSPAIDAIPTTECIQNDIDGDARPKPAMGQCDQGADEY
jgi:hypothetical protein